MFAFLPLMTTISRIGSGFASVVFSVCGFDMDGISKEAFLKAEVLKLSVVRRWMPARGGPAITEKAVPPVAISPPISTRNVRTSGGRITAMAGGSFLDSGPVANRHIRPGMKHAADADMKTVIAGSKLRRVHAESRITAEPARESQGVAVSSAPATHIAKSAAVKSHAGDASGIFESPHRMRPPPAAQAIDTAAAFIHAAISTRLSWSAMSFTFSLPPLEETTMKNSFSVGGAIDGEICISIFSSGSTVNFNGFVLTHIFRSMEPERVAVPGLLITSFFHFPCSSRIRLFSRCRKGCPVSARAVFCVSVVFSDGGFSAGVSVMGDGTNSAALWPEASGLLSSVASCAGVSMRRSGFFSRHLKIIFSR